MMIKAGARAARLLVARPNTLPWAAGQPLEGAAEARKVEPQASAQDEEGAGAPNKEGGASGRLCRLP